MTEHEQTLATQIWLSLIASRQISKDMPPDELAELIYEHQCQHDDMLKELDRIID